MRNFLSVNDVQDPIQLAREAIELKKEINSSIENSGKTVCLLFFNASLRTRLSMTKASQELGVNVITLNVSNEMWQLEFADGVVMDSGKAEHIKDAINVISLYCDVLAVRSFASLENREGDYKEEVLNSIKEYSKVPLINMESSTVHPLQSLADLMTILETSESKMNPKVVLTWAPHIKPLPQAVANSFAEWMNKSKYDLHIAAPAGFELNELFTHNTPIYNNQLEAFENADFIYVKNWSSFKDYGKALADKNWTVSQDKLRVSNNAKILHCLPVRRNLVIDDQVLDSSNSLIYQQAENRKYASKIVLKKLLNII